MDEGEVKPTDAKTAPEKPAHRWGDPTVVALFTVAGSILTAVLAFASNIWVTNETNKNSLVVERFKAQSNIILQAIKTGSETDACKNLVVFVKLGLVDDGSHTIQNACSSEFLKVAPPSLPISFAVDAAADAVRDNNLISLSGISKLKSVDEMMAALPTLTGIVQDADTHKPIDGASVFYDPQRVTLTSKDGSFSVPPAPTNLYDLHLGQPDYVRVEKNGYVPVTVPIWLSEKNKAIPLHRSR